MSHSFCFLLSLPYSWTNLISLFVHLINIFLCACWWIDIWLDHFKLWNSVSFYLSKWCSTWSSSTRCCRSFETLFSTSKHINTLIYYISIWWWWRKLFFEISFCQIIKITCFKLYKRILILSPCTHKDKHCYFFNNLNRCLIFGCCNHVWLGWGVKHTLSDFRSWRTSINEYYRLY